MLQFGRRTSAVPNEHREPRLRFPEQRPAWILQPQRSPKRCDHGQQSRKLPANADVAQLVEHFTRNEGVPGSSPGVGLALICRYSLRRAGHRQKAPWNTYGTRQVAVAVFAGPSRKVMERLRAGTGARRRLSLGPASSADDRLDYDRADLGLMSGPWVARQPPREVIDHFTCVVLDAVDECRFAPPQHG